MAPRTLRAHTASSLVFKRGLVSAETSLSNGKHLGLVGILNHTGISCKDIFFKATESIPIFSSPGPRRGRQVRSWRFPSMAGLPPRTQGHLRGGTTLWGYKHRLRNQIQLASNPNSATYQRASDTFSGLSILVCKIRMVIVSTSQDLCEG